MAYCRKGFIDYIYRYSFNPNRDEWMSHWDEPDFFTPSASHLSAPLVRGKSETIFQFLGYEGKNRVPAGFFKELRTLLLRTLVNKSRDKDYLDDTTPMEPILCYYTYFLLIDKKLYHYDTKELFMGLLSEGGSPFAVDYYEDMTDVITFYAISKGLSSGDYIQLIQKWYQDKDGYQSKLGIERLIDADLKELTYNNLFEKVIKNNAPVERMGNEAYREITRRSQRQINELINLAPTENALFDKELVGLVLDSEDRRYWYYCRMILHILDRQIGDFMEEVERAKETSSVNELRQYISKEQKRNFWFITINEQNLSDYLSKEDLLFNFMNQSNEKISQQLRDAHFSADRVTGACRSICFGSEGQDVSSGWFRNVLLQKRSKKRVRELLILMFCLASKNLYGDMDFTLQEVNEKLARARLTPVEPNEKDYLALFGLIENTSDKETLKRLLREAEVSEEECLEILSSSSVMERVKQASYCLDPKIYV